MVIPRDLEDLSFITGGCYQLQTEVRSDKGHFDRSDHRQFN